MTRITILTYGSRGDVQPYVALGRGLQRAGFDVRLAAPGVFADFAAEHGLDFAPLAGDPAILSQRLVDEAGLRPLRTMQAVIEYAMPLGLQVLAQCKEAARDADAILYGFLMTYAGHEAAQDRGGIPEIFAQMYPMFVPTRAFPAMLFPRLPVFTPTANRLTHHVFAALFRASNELSYAALRRRYPDLPPLRGWPFDGPRPPLVLFGYSPHVIPRPDDWPAQVHVTGFWTLDEEDPDWQPPPDLEAFLADGPPPVYIGFGSVVTRDITALTDLVLEAVALAGQRAVLLGGWGGLGRADLPDNVYRLDSAPHSWLFPRMAAVVHHGGVGTTAAGLRAGVPSVIVPFGSDQMYWGRHVQALGVGPAPLPRRQLTAQALAYAIRVAATHGPMRQRAAALGQKLRAEDGVRRAVEIITRMLPLS
ncbi:MAG: glycosyltransferase [Anaerolineae bacterium]